MRILTASALLLIPLGGAAAQQQQTPAATDAPGAYTPAPVPSVTPQTDQTPGMSAPAEQIAPTDPGDLRRDAGPRDSTPLSGAPTPEEGRSTPELGK